MTGTYQRSRDAEFLEKMLESAHDYVRNLTQAMDRCREREVKAEAASTTTEVRVLLPALLPRSLQHRVLRLFEVLQVSASMMQLLAQQQDAWREHCGHISVRQLKPVATKDMQVWQYHQRFKCIAAG